MSLPWLPYLVTFFLDGYLKPDFEAFEWGSGDSTLWLAERVRRVVSVEHDREWFDKLPDPGNVEALLIEPEPGAIKADKADPLAYYSTRLGDVNLTRYATAVDDYGLFDLVLVDGRARPSCLMHGSEHVRSGGVLVLDNSERAYYLERTAYLFQDWDRMDVLGHGPHVGWQWQATVWRKPDDAG